MVNGGYTHKFDNEVKLYPNLYHARNNGTAITTESNPWMCTVAQANTIDKFSGCNFDASRYDENQQYLFVHSTGTLIDEQGWKDHELDGKVVIGKFNTGFNQNVDENNVPILGSNGEIVPVNTATAAFPNTLCKPHIEVRMHLWPHILTINPATNALNTVTNKKAGYYSSTLILDYDALIPEGVQCYFIEGLMTKKIESNENVNVMFKTALFGKGGNEEGVNHVLPANTPVYIRSDKDPGLYDFQPLWEFDYLGWENLRGTDFHTLHGVESEPGRIIKQEYIEPLKKAKQMKAEMKNMLVGFVGEKHPTTNMEAEEYNTYSLGKLPVTPRHVLTLTRNTVGGTNAIGFWPYLGTAISAHRCYILGTDFNKELSKLPENNQQPPMGATFYFEDDDTTTTAIATVNTTEKQQDGKWYTLSGQVLSGKPAKSGIYVHNGKKVVLK